MIKTIKAMLKANKESYHMPKRVQDLIPIRRVWENGIFQVGPKLYSRTFEFTDINYISASEETQNSIIDHYEDMLRGLDEDTVTKITLTSRPMDIEWCKQSLLMPFQGDGKDEYRKECNDLVMNGILDGNGKQQNGYITITVNSQDYEQAQMHLKQDEKSLTSHLTNLGSTCTALTAPSKLSLLQKFYRPHDAGVYPFNVKDIIRKGHDFRDAICPDSLEKYNTYLRLGNQYVRIFYLKDYAPRIKYSFLSELLSSADNVTVSMDMLAVPVGEAKREVERLLLGVDTNITNWQRRQNRNNNFSAMVPYDMQMQRDQLTGFLDELDRENQRMLFCILTVMIASDTKEKLEADSKALLSAAQNRLCQMAVLTYQQLDGLNTVLPIGAQKLQCFRTLTSGSQAAFMPFRIQERMDPGGIYLGNNRFSHKPILINRSEQMNQAAMIFGVPGSGKSFLAKQMAAIMILSTKEHIIIIDPEGEYGPFVGKLTDDAAVIRICAGGKDRLNALTMLEGYRDNEKEAVGAKVDFILSLVEQIDGKQTLGNERSLIDRCLRLTFEEAKQNSQEPTLRDLRLKLMEQPEAEAHRVALALELYTEGSLDIFGGTSTVDLSKRVIVFDLHGLGDSLRPAAMLVLTDTIMNLVTLNWKKGIRTHILFDEFHIFLKLKRSTEFIVDAWKTFRKRNASPTAITQNVEFLLNSEKGRMMVSDSELVIMLNQAQPDQEELAVLLNLSDDQLRAVSNVPAGCGLIRCGPFIISFENHFPKETKLYELMTTKPGEGIFSQDSA